MSIQRERVTWCRWDAKAMRQRISHPTVWIWTDEEGTERTFDTKAEAEAARAAREAELAIDYSDVWPPNHR